jgi:hypothetical protein
MLRPWLASYLHRPSRWDYSHALPCPAPMCSALKGEAWTGMELTSVHNGSSAPSLPPSTQPLVLAQGAAIRWGHTELFTSGVQRSCTSQVFSGALGGSVFSRLPRDSRWLQLSVPHCRVHSPLSDREGIQVDWPSPARQLPTSHLGSRKASGRGRDSRGPCPPLRDALGKLLTQGRDSGCSPALTPQGCRQELEATLTVAPASLLVLLFSPTIVKKKKHK